MSKNIRFTQLLGIFCLILLAGNISLAQQSVLDEKEDGDNPEDRLYFDYLRTRNPKTGEVPEGIRALELAFMRRQAAKLGVPFAPGDFTSPWINRGPFNVGGRTRALAVDVRNEDIILAGGVSGGMWRSTDQGATWKKTTGSNELQSVTCIAQDFTNPDVWYYGTGEFSGNSANGSGAFFLGEGIYKSIDNGQNWSLLPRTASGSRESYDQSFDINMEIVVNPVNGDLYVATLGVIQRSVDGGGSFDQVLTNSSSQWADIVATNSGTLYAALDGRGVFTSTDGVNWSDITPESGFSLSTGDRKELALAPSNPNILYLLGEDSNAASQHSLWKFDASSGSWENRSANIPQFGGLTGDFNSQGGYDLLIKVKPDDENFVIIGGTNLFRSTDGFSSSDNTTWIGGYTADNTSYGLYPDHHPDQHSFVFLSNNRAISGNDGGVQITSDITTNLAANEAVDWVSLNNGYVTTQVYALSAGPGDQIMAGFQDNSTWLTTSPQSNATWTDQFGGDGAYNAFSADGTTRYMSWQRGNVFRAVYNEGADDTSADDIIDFAPSEYASLLFIAPFYLDPEDDELFYLGGNGNFFVNTQASTGSSTVGWKRIDLDASGVVSEIGVSSPSLVYVGTSRGDLFKIEDPGGSPIVTEITSDDFSGGYISAVAVDPFFPDQVLVTLSNYGIPSVFFTYDGGTTWEDVSGNLEENPDGSGSGPSVRSATILGSGDRYFVGTSTGLYSTASLSGSSTIWTKEDESGIGEVVVEHLLSRQSDGLVLAGTHGNGVYSANFEVEPPLLNDLSVVEITSPELTIASNESSEVIVSAILRNLGSASQSNYEIIYSVDNQRIGSDIVSQVIAPGESLEVTFTANYDFSDPGTYGLKVEVSLQGDEDVSNNLLSVEVNSEAPIEVFPFVENFDESLELPPLWKAPGSRFKWLVNTGSTPTPGTGPDGDNTTGSGNYAYTESTRDGSIRTELFTPWINVSGLETPVLSFYYHMFGATIGELEVLVLDMDDHSSSIFTLSGEQQESTDAPYRQAIVSLDQFKGEVIRLIFRVKDVFVSVDRGDLAIDDVSIYSIPTHDLAVTTVRSPQKLVSDNEPVTIEVTNLGVEDQTDFQVSYSVNGNEVVTETVVGTLPSGESVMYTFSKLYDFSETGMYEVAGAVNLENDENRENDVLTKTVSNIGFTGYYLMEQSNQTTTGPSSYFGDGYLFGNEGASKVLITAESATSRTLNLSYFGHLGPDSEVMLGFELNEDGTTPVSEEADSGFGCDNQVFLGPGGTPGEYDPDDDSQFTITIKEDVFQGCGVGFSDVSFLLTKVPVVNPTDSLALLALYESTNGTNWATPWNLEENVIFWKGVTVASSGRVVGLDLESNNLTGSLPDELADLTALLHLDLSYNQLRVGQIPPAIYSLEELKVLKLEQIRLTGNISEELGNLEDLVELNLSYNRLTGEIPASIGNLVNLKELQLRFNALSGTIPSGLGNLINLESIDLDYNQLTGTLPVEMGNLFELSSLKLQFNNLSGDVPETFKDLKNLISFEISDNQFSGLPDLSGLNLQRFDVERNKLDFGDLVPNYRVLTYYSPQAHIGPPLALAGLIGEDLHLTTVTFDNGNNKYQWFKNGQKIDGATDATFVLQYSGPEDSGKYHCQVTNHGAGLIILKRYINVVDHGTTQRTDYPALEALYLATNGPEWPDNSNWLTSAPFNEWTGITTNEEGRVTAIQLEENYLGGELPDEIGDLSELTKLSLRSFMLKGNIPSTIINLSKLEYLDLHFNQLSGNIPDEIWSVSSLKSLNLGRNAFRGTLPDDIENLVNLEEFDIGGSDLSGTLPSKLFTISSLRLIGLSGNHFSGVIPEAIGQLELLEQLALSGNQFSGEIPSAISQLGRLEYLFLSNNQFSGEIPADIGLLTDLIHINFDHNYLEGEIPVEMGNLLNLRVLSLRDNNLSGELPSSVTDLTNLSILNIEDNLFTGAFPQLLPDTNIGGVYAENNLLTELPDLSGIRAAFRFQSNKLSFADILPNVIAVKQYAPQKPLDEEISDFVNQGDSYTMEVSDDAEGNLYQWYRNEIPVKGATSRTLTIGNFQVVNTGTYYCEITNPGAPSLTLIRNSIDLDINYSPSTIQIDNQLVAENQLVGAIVGSLSVIPFDLGDEYAWGLSGTDAASFSLEGNLLKTAAEFDFESDNSFDITVSVIDQGGLTTQADLTITIENVNEAPELVIPLEDLTTDEDDNFELVLPDDMFTDPDGDEFTISIEGLPEGLSFDEASLTISGIPVQGGVGVNTIIVTATDPSDASTSDSFELTVTNVNDAPQVSNAQDDISADEDLAFTYTIPDDTFYDEDSDELTLSVIGLPSGLSFDASDNSISGTPLQADVGVFTIEVTATDPSSASVSDSFTLTINNVNDAPVVVTEQGDISADEDAPFEYEIPQGTFSDEDGDDLTLKVSGLPESLTFDAGTRKITGTPLAADIGAYAVEVTAADPSEASATDTFELTVTAVNDAPELITELGDVATDIGVEFSLTISPENVTDEEGDVISVSASGLPNSLTMTGGTINGTPVQGENGDYSVVITYSDGNGGSVTDTFVLTVNTVTSLEEEREYGQITVQPNPFTNEIVLKVEKGLFGHTSFTLQPVGAKAIWTHENELVGQTELTLKIDKPVSEGVYLLIVRPEGKVPVVKKVIKQD